ncbi:MAG: hypothetical protein COA45_11305 [Zetaproteobacteria bacterium]|nr:MAG: hypothetical protein COA45_11305 [Zetaproteobacteria bacterium]
MTPIAIHEKAIQNTFYKIHREGVKSIAVTSVRRHDGVSAFSYALARRAATAGVKVLLIDLNFMHPGQSEALALEHHDWNPSVQIEAYSIQNISNTNLAVLSSPQKVKDTWPFQDQDNIRHMLNSLNKDYDLIIADMPSILEPESELQVEILCAAFDAAMIIALSGKTIEMEMTKVKKMFDEAEVKILGSVMNDQFMPTLPEELKRQLNKFHPRFPHITDFLKRWIDRNAFLNQSL